jgi:hypothetical protein
MAFSGKRVDLLLLSRLNEGDPYASHADVLLLRRVRVLEWVWHLSKWSKGLVW